MKMKVIVSLAGAIACGIGVYEWQGGFALLAVCGFLVYIDTNWS